MHLSKVGLEKDSAVTVSVHQNYKLNIKIDRQSSKIFELTLLGKIAKPPQRLQ